MRPERSEPEMWRDRELRRWELPQAYQQRIERANAAGRTHRTSLDVLVGKCSTGPLARNYDATAQAYNNLGLIVISLHALRKKFPATRTWGPVEQGPSEPKKGMYLGFARYKHLNKAEEISPYIAYGCNDCKKLVIGPPRIEVSDTLGVHRLSGSENMTYFCAYCAAPLYHQIGRMS